LYNPFIILFGIGVFLSAKNKLSLKFSGALLVIWGIIDYLWMFFPMNMRGNIGSATDSWHLIIAAVTVLSLTLIMGFGSGAKGKKFRIYSIMSIVVMLSLGFILGKMAPKVAANEPTHWIGIIERITVFTPMIWMSILAIILIYNENGSQ
jgi:hypothetical protein